MRAPDHFFTSALMAGVLAGAAGCADEPSEESEAAVLAVLDDGGAADPSDAGREVAPRDAGPDAGVLVPHPSEPYYARIEGTGCRTGSTYTHVHADGKTFSTAFSEFEVVTQPTAPSAVTTKDCVLKFALHHPRGASFKLDSLVFGGYAFIEPGVTGSFGALHYFSGRPRMERPRRVRMTGPYDDDFAYRGDTLSDALAWSPCGLEHALTIYATAEVRSGEPRRSGYVVVGGLPSRADVQLSVRPCTPTPASPPISPGDR